MDKRLLFEHMRIVIEAAESIYKDVIEHNLENTQEFLDWLDKLNEISVRK